MSVTYPQGFKAAGAHVGLRGRLHPDMAIIQNLGPLHTVAGVFTSNRVFAAPVGWDREVVAGGTAQAVVVNSGNANACTGEQGKLDAAQMAAHLGTVLGVPTRESLVCSTGIIGRALDMQKITKGIEQVAAKLRHDGGFEAAEAILTTDAVLEPGPAQAILQEVVDESFNRLDSDGCMSTNDTVLLMASGASGESPDLALFKEKLLEACQDLSLQLLGDAEGAHHDVEIKVTKAASVEGALFAARTIARSNLVKTAIYGNDPNWGRILSQLGTVPEDILPFDPGQVNVYMNGVKVCENGGIGEEPYLADLKPRECHILVELNAGEQEAFIWTSDLTHEYVHINGDYTT